MKAVFASCNPVLEIYRNCGKLLKSKDKEIKKTVNEYLKAVELAGFEMATQNYVSKETKAKLEMQLMSTPALPLPIFHESGKIPSYMLQ